MLTLTRYGNINLLDEKVYEYDLKIEKLEKENSESKDKINELQRINKELIQRLENLEK